MVYPKDIKELEFSSIEEYFQYIVDSHTNGQFKQVRGLISKLSSNQRIQFINWMSFNLDKTSKLYESIVITLV